MPLTEQETLEIQSALKRCRPEVLEATLRFRETGDQTELPLIVYGIIERHLAAELTEKTDIHTLPDSTRLIEDLSVDSLTLLEIVLSIEEAVGISIENEELREIRTLGDVKTFIAKKVSKDGAKKDDSDDEAKKEYDFAAISVVLPQQPPFLFLDKATIENETVTAGYHIRGDEYFLEGHFRNNPVFPASIVFEALGQAACLWVLESAPKRLEIDLEAAEVLFASMGTTQFYRRAKPGDYLEFHLELQKLKSSLAIFNGQVHVRGERVARVENLMLAFGHSVMEHLDQIEIGSTQKEVASEI